MPKRMKGSAELSKIARGGAGFYNVRFLRCSFRLWGGPVYRCLKLGFRYVWGALP